MRMHAPNGSERQQTLMCVSVGVGAGLEGLFACGHDSEGVGGNEWIGGQVWIAHVRVCARV